MSKLSELVVLLLCTSVALGVGLGAYLRLWHLLSFPTYRVPGAYLRLGAQSNNNHYGNLWFKCIS